MFKYIKLADFLKQILIKKQQLKDIIYNQQSQSKLSNIKIDPRVAYSNISLILNNLSKFQQTFKNIVKIMKKNKQKPINNKYLLFVMIAEYLNVGKIVGGGQIKRVIMNNLQIIPDIQIQSKINKQIVHIRLRKCCTDIRQLNKWQEILNKYQNNQIIPNLYNLTHIQYSSLTNQQPKIRGTSACVIQSFSSNLPPYVLFLSLNLVGDNFSNEKNKNVKFDIIDACSAPGNKTIQLAEYLGDRGNVWAFQRDERRFQILSKNIKKYGVLNINPLNEDFLKSSPSQYPKVKVILLDPSCSGSGMLNNFTRDTNCQQISQNTSFQKFSQNRYQSLSQQQKKRVEQLKQLQLQLLSHSTKFKPFRICYSTCSIYSKQNQQVVKQFLQQNPQYCIKPVTNKMEKYQSMVPGFKKYGKQMKKCIRIDPRLKISDGFFVCVFGRKRQQKQIQQV